MVLAFARMGQTAPHAPQLFSSAVVAVSQPLVRLSPSQSAKPTLQVPVQVPPAQAATMLLREQAIPTQPPQVATEVLVSTSQPLLCRLPSQLARPTEQVPLHTLAPQVRDTMPVPEQTVPQVPHASGSDVRLRQTLEQSVWPEPQDVTHTPPEHNCSAVHARGAPAVEHAPQWALSLLRFTSQPLATLPSQLAKPALQLAMVHAPLAQPAVALASEQTLLQAPQLVGLVVVLISQPLATTPSQFPRPAAQTMLHTPPAHPAVPPEFEQRAPQPPQWFTSVKMVTSQPSLDVALQSRRSLGQVTADVPQAEALHTALVPIGGGGQTVVQLPQWLRSPETTFTSQPLTELASQSRNPVLHAAIVHRPATQLAPAFANWQRLPQTPQLLVSLPVAVSHPSNGSPLQSAKPALQAASTQAPARHPATPLAKEQTVPQARQLFGSVLRSRHTPEQFVVGALHVVVQMPAEQTVPAAHPWPQDPQWLLSVWRSRQVPEQTLWPTGQTQLRPEHNVPLEQALPQAPQFVLSVARSRHTRPHAV